MLLIWGVLAVARKNSRIPRGSHPLLCTKFCNVPETDLNCSKPAEQPGILVTSYGFFTRLSEVTENAPPTIPSSSRTAQHYSKERGIDAMENYSHKIRNAEESAQDRPARASGWFF
jgi:hypothetical protein